MNAIKVQEKLIAKLMKYDPRGRNYYGLITRAAKSARRDLMACGFDQTLADRVIHDCHDMALVTRVFHAGALVKVETL